MRPSCGEILTAPLICTERVCVYSISIDRQAGEVSRPVSRDSESNWGKKRSPARDLVSVKMIKFNTFCWKENYELRQTIHKVTRTILSRNPALLPLLTRRPWISCSTVNVNRDVGGSITDEDKGVKLPWAADWKREARQGGGTLQVEQKSIRRAEITLGGGGAHQGEGEENRKTPSHYIRLQVWAFLCVCRRRIHLHTMCKPTHETLLGGGWLATSARHGKTHAGVGPSPIGVLQGDIRGRSHWGVRGG